MRFSRPSICRPSRALWELLHLACHARAGAEWWIGARARCDRHLAVVDGRQNSGRQGRRQNVAQAQANKRAEQTQITQLVQAYFGQLFTQEVLTVRQDVRDGLAEHLERAIRSWKPRALPPGAAFAGAGGGG